MPAYCLLQGTHPATLSSNYSVFLFLPQACNVTCRTTERRCIGADPVRLLPDLPLHHCTVVEGRQPLQHTNGCAAACQRWFRDDFVRPLGQGLRERDWNDCIAGVLTGFLSHSMAAAHQYTMCTGYVCAERLYGMVLDIRGLGIAVIHVCAGSCGCSRGSSCCR